MEQQKQNVPWIFWSRDQSSKSYDQDGNFNKVNKTLSAVIFFRTLIANSMMSLTKSFFGLTAYMQNDKILGIFFEPNSQRIYLDKEMILKLTGFEDLMENEPAGKASPD